MSNLGSRPKNIRSRNKQLIVEMYRNSDALSVSTIADRIKLSRTTVIKINEALLREGTIEAAGKGDSTDEGGKKPLVFRFNARKKLVLSFHIKYDRVYFRLSDLRCQSLAKDEIEIGRSDEFPKIALKMKELISRNEGAATSGASYLACVVAIHGNVDSDSGICIHATHFPAWGTYLDLRKHLEEILALDCPYYIDNWIRLKAYGENRLGLAKDHESVVLIDVGKDGAAAGILESGKIYPGKHYLSGEIAHIRVNVNDREICACGSSGCFERQISMERLAARARARAAETPDSLLNGVPETDLPAIFSAADRGDSLARSLLDEIAGWFAIMISHIIMFYDPEIILLEGDYASDCAYFEGELDRRTRELALPRLSRHTTITFNSKESVATLKGAALLAVDKYYNPF